MILHLKFYKIDQLKQELWTYSLALSYKIASTIMTLQHIFLKFVTVSKATNIYGLKRRF